MDKPNQTAVKMFFYWMNERHRIYLAKEAGKPWPWTKDDVLQEFKFTNVYRNLDRVTKELHRLVFSRYRDGGTSWKKNVDLVSLMMGICVFRMFNWPPTFELLVSSGAWDGTKWWRRKAVKVLTQYASNSKVFTGAYIITGGGMANKGETKVELACDAVDALYRARHSIVASIMEFSNLEQSVKLMCDYPMVGRFIAYELVTDFRWTPILCEADDIMEWANPGPGAVRGLSRIYYGDISHKGSVQSCIDRMKDLLVMSQKRGMLGKHMQPLEMRDIEHSLCEFDKYMRVKNVEGRPRSKYIPVQCKED